MSLEGGMLCQQAALLRMAVLRLLLASRALMAELKGRQLEGMERRENCCLMSMIRASG
jgi:hypothetical protein